MPLLLFLCGCGNDDDSDSTPRPTMTGVHKIELDISGNPLYFGTFTYVVSIADVREGGIRLTADPRYAIYDADKDFSSNTGSMAGFFELTGNLHRTFYTSDNSKGLMLYLSTTPTEYQGKGHEVTVTAKGYVNDVLVSRQTAVWSSKVGSECKLSLTTF